MCGFKGGYTPHGDFASWIVLVSNNTNHNTNNNTNNTTNNNSSNSNRKFEKIPA